jgi:hypothetical protein
MNEIVDGVFHWKGKHPKIGIEVSSYFDVASRTLLDPLEPDAGRDWFAQEDREPERIVLTNRHHERDSVRFVERFGCQVLCPQTGLHEFEDKSLAVEPYGPGEIAPGVRAVEVAAICPDDMALVLDRGPGLLAIADALVNYGGIGFVPDNYMDDPQRVKSATYERFRAILEQVEFDGLLFAHGEPIPSGGRAALRAFVDAAARA